MRFSATQYTSYPWPWMLIYMPMALHMVWPIVRYVPLSQDALKFPYSRCHFICLPLQRRDSIHSLAPSVGLRPCELAAICIGLLSGKRYGGGG
jgi:hypothetical protein